MNLRICTTCATLLWLALLYALPARAQQTLFNVPSGRATQRGSLFAQEQVSLAQTSGVSGSTLDVGLGGGFELGLNVMGLALYAPASDTAGLRRGPWLMVNAQESFALDARGVFSLAIGAQVGARNLGGGNYALADFSWLLATAAIDQRGSRVFAGGYHSNRALGGAGLPVGGLLGLEVVLVPDRLALQLDYISGDRELSAGVVGVVIELPSDWQFSVGVQVPTPRSANMLGLVFELTEKGLPLRGKVLPPEMRLTALETAPGA